MTGLQGLSVVSFWPIKQNVVAILREKSLVQIQLVFASAVFTTKCTYLI